MKMMRKLGKALRGGAVASTQRMAPAMGGAVTAAPKKAVPMMAGAVASATKKMQPALGGVAAAKVAQPMAAQAAAMPRKAPLSNLRSSVKSMAANVKTAVAKQPALQKAVASQANKPVGRLVRGLSSKFLKRR